jgi:hypothetical protein
MWILTWHVQVGGGAYIHRWRGEARWQLQVEVKVVVVHAIVPKLGPCWTQQGHLQ